MSEKVTSSGKTIEIALENALKQLGATEDQVTYVVIQQPENGVFGIFGKKDAILEVTREDTKVEKAVQFLDELFNTMGIECEIEATEDKDFLRLNLIGDKMGILIGRRGQTLDAIQYLTSLVINKGGDDYTRLIIDTENYRDKRQKTLEGLADKMANKAVRFRRRIKLEPMNPAERRIIHARLQDNDKVTTYSEGQDPYRRIVIQAN